MKIKSILFVAFIVFSLGLYADEEADKQREALLEAAQKENMPNKVYSSVQDDIDKKERAREAKKEK